MLPIWVAFSKLRIRVGNFVTYLRGNVWVDESATGIGSNFYNFYNCSDSADSQKAPVFYLGGPEVPQANPWYIINIISLCISAFTHARHVLEQDGLLIVCMVLFTGGDRWIISQNIYKVIYDIP